MRKRNEDEGKERGSVEANLLPVLKIRIFTTTDREERISVLVTVFRTMSSDRTHEMSATRRRRKKSVAFIFVEVEGPISKNSLGW